MPRPIPFTDDQLREAVRVSGSLLEVSRRLHLTVGGKTYAKLRREILRLGVDAPQLPLTARRRGFYGRRAWTDDELRDVVRVLDCARASLQPA
ncbi:hypothetical protein [uncultured Jatrophihabitans sp.]|uniref:hypothetical protein n=1 Tax=uncultured Jatrophihabitans sp. TaxID=1610747 RepID=UPI0035CB246A